MLDRINWYWRRGKVNQARPLGVTNEGGGEANAVLNRRPCRGDDRQNGYMLVTATVQRGQQGDSESKRAGTVGGWRVACGPKHSRSWALPIFCLVHIRDEVSTIRKRRRAARKARFDGFLYPLRETTNSKDCNLYGRNSPRVGRDTVQNGKPWVES